jgi:hypothetical protein
LSNNAMEAEIIIRGFPPRQRFAEWGQANTLPAEELPRLTKEQAERARKLRITEKGFAVALKAGELAQDQSFEVMERVAKRIHQVLRKHDPHSELAKLVWDFGAHRFDYIVKHQNGQEEALETTYPIPPEMVDEVVLEHEGAEQKLVAKVVYDLELLG